MFARGALQMLDNVSRSPCSEFRAPMARWGDLIGDAQLILHSHPGGEPIPSIHDMRQALAIGLPWYVKPRGGEGFYFGTGAPQWQLIGRPYRFGVTDCFALIRDGLRALYDLSIRDYARDWGFWERGEGLFESNLKREGFEVVATALHAAQPGDVLLFRVRSKVANHAGLVINGGQMLHHPTPGRAFEPTYLSQTASLERWQRFPVLVCRHA